MTRVEWQVSWDEGTHLEIHVFVDQDEAERFLAARPKPDVHEGGVVYPPVSHLRKVVRHARATPPISDSQKEGQRT